MVAPDGRVWFVGQVGNYISVLDPKTGGFEKFDMDEGVNPHNLIVDSDGMIYYSGNRASHIGRLDPETGKVEKFMMPDERARDPHTLIFDSMGDVWFTAQNGNFVGKFWTETGEVRLLETPSAPGRGGRMGSSTRFARSRNVGAYLGLTPRRFAPGEVDWNARISKCGDALVRTYLFEAAGAFLTSVRLWPKADLNSSGFWGA